MGSIALRSPVSELTWRRAARPLGCLLLLSAPLGVGCSGGDPGAGAGGEANGSGGDGSGGEANVGGGANAGMLEPSVASDPDAPVVGTFTVSMPPPHPSTDVAAVASFQGVVRDGPAVEMTSWSVLEEDAHCVLYEPSIPFCEPACASGSACVTGGTCQAYPEARSLGKATVTGLALEGGEAEFTLTPLRPNFNYLPGASVTLVNPPAQPGAAVQLHTEGGDYDPVTLVALGIEALDFHTNGEPLPFAPEASALLEWTPPADPEASQILVDVDISHHGGVKGKIECIAPDTGTLEISQSMVAGLIELGVAGFPTITVRRRSAGSANIGAGQVALEIVSGLELPLAIPGLVSCSGPADCQDGQLCGTDRTCQ